MADTNTFEYAIVRVVPRVERGEFVNAGVLLYCRALGFLETAIELDPERLRALDPAVELGLVESHLASFERICRGGEDAGPIGALSQAERFRWLAAPRSTVIQASEVHEGVCTDPREALERAMRTHVRPARR